MPTNYTDTNPAAARDFYREVRQFSERAKPWDGNAIFYDTLPDEVMDVTKVSRRVYGRPDEFLAVLAAAGLDTFDQPMTQRRLVLPSPAKLMELKRRCKFESQAAYRESGAPIWAE